MKRPEINWKLIRCGALYVLTLMALLASAFVNLARSDWWNGLLDVWAVWVMPGIISGYYEEKQLRKVEERVEKLSERIESL